MNTQPTSRPRYDAYYFRMSGLVRDDDAPVFETSDWQKADRLIECLADDMHRIWSARTWYQKPGQPKVYVVYVQPENARRARAITSRWKGLGTRR